MSRRTRRNILGIGMISVLGLAGAATAQIGVHKLAVQKRIYSMSDMAADAKLLGHMAKGKVAFDAKAAQTAVNDIAAEAARIPTLFKAFETEPGSDARSTIWSNYSDFTARANALEQAAARATIRGAGDLAPALGSIGAACSGCHKAYRK